jgi:adenine C2-methylase RlmN of 23S rRNA A2503 and tRNA A37
VYFPTAKVFQLYSLFCQCTFCNTIRQGFRREVLVTHKLEWLIYIRKIRNHICRF